jgi:hypothetical protein
LSRYDGFPAGTLIPPVLANYYVNVPVQIPLKSGGGVAASDSLRKTIAAATNTTIMITATSPDPAIEAIF